MRQRKGADRPLFYLFVLIRFAGCKLDVPLSQLEVSEAGPDARRKSGPAKGPENFRE